MKILFTLAFLGCCWIERAQAQDTYIANNLVLDGSNKWVFHTPDDGRTSLYIAPNWDWSRQTRFLGSGDVIFFAEDEHWGCKLLVRLLLGRVGHQ